MGVLLGTAGLVTAAGDGIGRASALALAAAGGRLVVSDIDDSKGEETVRLITEAGGEAFFVSCDVSDEKQVADLVAAVVDVYGRIDWAHNNAGFGTAPGPVTEMRRDPWDHCLAITLTGTMLCLKHELSRMRAQGLGGSVVNTASVSGLVGQANQSAYVSAKWGVIGLTKSAALEVAAEGIRVNAICPGMTLTASVEHWFRTDPLGAGAVEAAIPMGRAALVEDQAQAVVWLCSPHSAYVTGVALPIDGGLTAR